MWGEGSKQRVGRKNTSLVATQNNYMQTEWASGEKESRVEGTQAAQFFFCCLYVRNPRCVYVHARDTSTHPINSLSLSLRSALYHLFLGASFALRGENSRRKNNTHFPSFFPSSLAHTQRCKNNDDASRACLCAFVVSSIITTNNLREREWESTSIKRKASEQKRKIK